MTPRQIVNLSLGIASALALGIVQVFFSSEEWAGPAELVIGAFLVGLLTPGSPVGRALDGLTGAPSAEAADAVADALRARPGSVVTPAPREDETPRLGPNVHVRPAPRRIPRRPEDGSAAIDLLAAIVCTAIGTAILIARGL